MLVISKLEWSPVGSSYGVADKVNVPYVLIFCTLHFTLFKFLKSRTSKQAEPLNKNRNYFSLTYEDKKRE